MKKFFFFAALAAAVFSSCSNEENLADPTSAIADNAISFSAYSGSSVAVTRGTTMSTEDFIGDKGGVGVFAFYQPATDGVAGPNFTTVKYSTANFMYNQKVAYTASASTGGTWSYTPVKYWPNNKGDKVTYFAYAPYEETTVWDDLNVSTNNQGTEVYRKFSVNSNVDEQTDYLFAAPNLNLKKPSTISDNTNPEEGTGSATVTAVKNASGSESNVVNFNFKHVTSKINLYVGVQVNDEVNKTNGSYTAAAADAKAWTDPYTTIEIKSIQFKDLAKDFTVTAQYASADAAKCADADVTVASTTDNSERNQNYVVKPYTDANAGVKVTGFVNGVQYYSNATCETKSKFASTTDKYYLNASDAYSKASGEDYDVDATYYTFALTEDDTFLKGKTYYTVSDDVYSKASVVAGADVTASTYYECTPAKVTGDDLNDANYKKGVNYGLISADEWAEGWHRYLKLCTSSDDDNTADSGDMTAEENPTTADNNSEYMFIAPQKVKDQQIVITYTVTTKAEPGKTNNNDSKVTNTIVKTWDDLGISELQYGKQYQLFFLIGMQDVKVAATTCDWEKGTNNLVNVPAASETPDLPE